jgi:mannose-6-phosphate isomerase
LVGFRLPEEIHEILNLIDSPALEPAAASLDGTDHGTSRAFARLGALTTREVEDLTAEIRARIHLHEAFRTVSELALYYPGDPGVILSMMLRRHDLAPGEAIFVASGVPHAYLNGLAVEIMASSDNVFRAGLTTKSVDLDECVANLITRPAERFASSDHVGLFAPPVAEFALLVLHPDTRAVLEPGGPRMVLVTEGTATITTGNDTRLVERGQCVLIRHDDGAATVDSRGMAVVASTSATVTVTHGAGG